VDPTVPSLIVLEGPELSLEPGAVEASYPVMVAPPDRLQPLLRDLRALNATILAQEPQAGLVALALGILLLSCWTFARMTRWPFFNAVLVFLCLRGALWLHWSLDSGELGRLVATAVDPSSFNLVFAGTLGFVSLVLLVALFLMQPLSAWRRELGDE
jgi:hypothetical protein